MEALNLFKQTNFSNTIWWRVNNDISGYKNEIGNELVTEIIKNRLFRIIETNLIQKNWYKKHRIFIQCFEDGYICWVDINNLVIEKYEENKIPYLRSEIEDKVWSKIHQHRYDVMEYLF